MSERGQKIFKWIVWIALIAIIALGIYKKSMKILNPPISRTEWVENLEESFGEEFPQQIGDGNKAATRDFVALTSMVMIGDERLSYYTDNTLTDDERISIAIDKGIVSQNEMDQPISDQDASEILDKVMDLYCGVESFPEYCSIRLEEGTVNGTEWNISNHNEDYTSFEVPKESFSGNEGDVILVRDDLGIAVPLEITAVEDTGSDTVRLETKEVDDSKNVIEAVDFSGAADFSYLLNSLDGGSGESDTGIEEGKANGRTGLAYNPNQAGAPMLLCASVPGPTLLAAGWWEDITDKVTEKTTIQGRESTPTANLEVAVQYRVDERDDKRLTITPRLNGKFIDPKLGKGYKREWTVPSDDEQVKVDFTDGADLSDRTNVNIDTKIKGTIKFKNLSVTADGYFECLDWDDQKNRVNVYVNSDIECDLKISQGVEGRFKLVTLDLPIAATGGTVAVDVTFYMVVGLNGEVTFTYEINGGHAGVEISVANGTITPVKSCKSKEFNLDAKVSLEAGFRGVVGVTVCNKYFLCDPYVDIKAGASAETLDKKEGFEDVPACMQLKLYAPLIKIGAHYGESTLAYKAINFIGWAGKDSFEIINADKAYSDFWGKQMHVEVAEDGNLVGITGGEEVCTHIKDVDLREELEKKAQEELDKKKQEAQKKIQEEIERRLEEMLNQWLEENCGGC